MKDIQIIHGEFERATPESQGIPSRAIRQCLDGIIEADQFVHSLHIFRNGYLIAGGSAKPFSDISHRRLYSTMKSVIATGVLFLVQEGKLRFDDTIADYFPESVPEDCQEYIRRITIRNVLNMSLGQQRDALRIYHKTNCGEGMIPFTDRSGAEHLPFDPRGLSLEEIFFRMPQEFEPGERFYYVNTAPELIIRLITKVSGEDIIRYLTPRLFEPLEIEYFNQQETWMEGWTADSEARKPDDPVIGYLDGATTVTTTRDLCKFALLFLQEGRWNGRQLLDPALIREATKLCLPTVDYAEATESFPEEDSYGYGMQVWRNQYGGYQFLGGLVQTALMIPEQNLCIVYTSMNMHTEEKTSAMPNLIRDYIYKHIHGAALPEDPEAFREMDVCFSAWSTAPHGLAAHDPSESARSGLFEVHGDVDGITAMEFHFQTQEVSIHMDGSVFSVRYGVNGNFVRNQNVTWHRPEGYTCIFGNDRTAVSASGGWSSPGQFVLQLQYDVDMVSYRYLCTFCGDYIELTRHS